MNGSAEYRANDPAEHLARETAAAADSLSVGEGQPSRSLSIAVLGPKLTYPTEAARNKRGQILQLLRDAGHRPFFPETRININQTWLPQEVKLLSSEEVDLVIVLDTDSSWGAAIEIGAFAITPEIASKTAILVPGEHFTPDNNLPANTIDSLFPIKVPYTKQDFDECCLLEDCREIVADFLTGESPMVRNLDV